MINNEHKRKWYGTEGSFECDWIAALFKNSYQKQDRKRINKEHMAGYEWFVVNKIRSGHLINWYCHAAICRQWSIYIDSISKLIHANPTTYKARLIVCRRTRMLPNSCGIWRKMQFRLVYHISMYESVANHLLVVNRAIPYSQAECGLSSQQLSNR